MSENFLGGARHVTKLETCLHRSFAYLALVLYFERTRGDRIHLVTRQNQNSALIGQDGITGIDDDTAAGDRNVDAPPRS